MAELIMDKEHPIEADRFLVMTFTNAAAAEMKERIGTELEERLEKDPDNLFSHAHEQQTEIPDP